MSAIDRAAGDSLEQKQAEELLIRLLAEKLETSLCKKRFPVPDGTWLEVDGYCETPSMLCEAWAHQGPPKPAQKNKVMADAFKLLYVANFCPPPVRLVLCFGDRDAAAHFSGRSWMARALEKSGIEVVTVDLPAEVKNLLRRAQQRQFR
jgi:hypothetical protein